MGVLRGDGGLDAGVGRQVVKIGVPPSTQGLPTTGKGVAAVTGDVEEVTLPVPTSPTRPPPLSSILMSGSTRTQSEGTGHPTGTPRAYRLMSCPFTRKGYSGGFRSAERT